MKLLRTLFAKPSQNFKLILNKLSNIKLTNQRSRQARSVAEAGPLAESEEPAPTTGTGKRLPLFRHHLSHIFLRTIKTAKSGGGGSSAVRRWAAPSALTSGHSLLGWPLLRPAGTIKQPPSLPPSLHPSFLPSFLPLQRTLLLALDVGQSDYLEKPPEPGLSPTINTRLYIPPLFVRLQFPALIQRHVSCLSDLICSVCPCF